MGSNRIKQLMPVSASKWDSLDDWVFLRAKPSCWLMQCCHSHLYLRWNLFPIAAPLALVRNLSIITSFLNSTNPHSLLWCRICLFRFYRSPHSHANVEWWLYWIDPQKLFSFNILLSSERCPQAAYPCWYVFWRLARADSWRIKWGFNSRIHPKFLLSSYVPHSLNH